VRFMQCSNFDCFGQCLRHIDLLETNNLNSIEPNRSVLCCLLGP
jgi:hypothetical protein